MKGNDSGFSLIELLAATAILGILAVAEMTFMSTGANLYRSVFGNVSLQVESQTTMNQLEDAVINCNGYLCFEDGELRVVNTATAQNTEAVYRLAADKKEIDYSRYTFTGGAEDASPTENVLMSSHVESLRITPATDSGGNITSVKISATFSRQGVTCSADQIVSPRNLPKDARKAELTALGYR